MNYPNIGYVYSYDQLNRLTGQIAFTDLDTASNEWGTASAVDDYKENVWYDPNGNITNYMRHGTTSGGSMDEMTYNYGYGSNNQLSHVDDAISAGTYPADIDDQANSNYSYDASGNLIGDVSEGITNEWTTADKLQRVTKTDMVIEFRYDAMGNRVSKNVTDNTDSVTTYYVRDAQGNVMAVYQYADNAAELRLNELHMYGSSRVGIRQEDELIWCQSCTLSVPPVSSAWAGRQIYELTNHLGNVLTTVSDKKVHFDNNNDNIADWIVPEIVSQNDYYPFGAIMPGRNFNAGDYRFGFNGKEKDDEPKGLGNNLDFGARIYDTRVGRFMSLDPLMKDYPSLGAYNFSNSNPILYIDVDGRKFVTYIKVRNEETGKLVKQKVTFDGVKATIQTLNGGKPTGEAIEYKAGTSQFVDDIITSYNYIVKNGADVDRAMQQIAQSEREIEVKESESAGAGSYINGKIKFDFDTGLEIYGDKGTGEYQGNQSPALGFWAEVYHAYLDLVEEKEFGHIMEEEEYVHVEKEGQVIDALKEADSNIKETKRSSYDDAKDTFKAKGATSTEEESKED